VFHYNLGYITYVCEFAIRFGRLAVYLRKATPCIRVNT